MMKLKSTLLTLIFIAFGIHSVNAQIAAANPQLVNQDGALAYVMGQVVAGEEISVADIHFEIRDYDGNKMDGITILGGEVYLIDGTETGTKVGSISSSGVFDAAAKSFFSGKENVQLKCVLKVEIEDVDQEMTFSYALRL